MRFGENYVLHPFNRRVRNIVWAIQACHRDRPDDDYRKLLLKIFEVTALRWVYKPMTGSENLTLEEIADLIEGQPTP